jgi:hypothetical protein
MKFEVPKQDFLKSKLKNSILSFMNQNELHSTERTFPERVAPEQSTQIAPDFCQSECRASEVGKILQECVVSFTDRQVWTKTSSQSHPHVYPGVVTGPGGL